MTFPNTGAPEWGAAQASPWATVNEAGYIWDAFASRSIIEDRDLTAPPGSCANGARYLIDTPATGFWAGHDGELAIALGTNASNGWYFADVAFHGNQLFVRDEDLLIENDGAVWNTAPGGVSSMDDLTDVDAPVPATGDLLIFNGSEYDNSVGIDTDGTMAANSDAKLPSQKAVRTLVNATLAGLSWKQAVRVATTAAGTLASDYENGDTVDGVVLATGNRILVKNQAAPAENGIYVVAASGAPTRATDADSAGELVNASVFVSEGTVNADTQWTCTTNATIVVGTTALTFAQFISSSYNDEAARDAIGAMLADSSTIDVTYNDAGDVMTLEVIQTDTDADAIGFRGAPLIGGGPLNADHTFALADSGKTAYHTDATIRTYTIPANGTVSFVVGTVIIISNENGAANISLPITTDTLRWGSSTGTRTIAPNGTATLLKVAATTWRLTGDGIA